MRQEQSRTDFGTIKIHKNVIASIARIAAAEIEGVKEVSRNPKCALLGPLSRWGAAAIKVEIDKNEEVKVDIPVIIKYGFNIPELANKVQENVRQALEKMTNLTIKDIDVSVQGIEKA
jgi:uncharacterized alkaline shock family protein YloU